MNCPVDGNASVVLKTLGAERRRQCTVCGHRFTTTEVLKEERQRETEAVAAVLEVAEKLKAAA